MRQTFGGEDYAADAEQVGSTPPAEHQRAYVTPQLWAGWNVPF